MFNNNFKAILIYSIVFLLCANIVFARWMAVDPQHKKYPSISPYVYANNNPLKFIDPDGEKVEYAPGNATEANIRSGAYNPRTDKNQLSKSFKSKMDASVKQIISTKRGNSLLYNLENKKDKQGNDIMFYITENKAGELFHVQTDKNTHIISVDPNTNPNVQLQDLSTGQTQSEPASTTRVLSHELGHAEGTKDDGKGKMNNVNKNENPIMVPLENKERTQY